MGYPTYDPRYVAPQPAASTPSASASGGGGMPSVNAGGGDIGQQISSYFKGRGVADSETPYWTQKWGEFGAKDPTYFNQRLSQADIFGRGGGGGQAGGGQQPALNMDAIRQVLQQLTQGGGMNPFQSAGQSTPQMGTGNPYSNWMGNEQKNGQQPQLNANPLPTVNQPQGGQMDQNQVIQQALMRAFMGGV